MKISLPNKNTCEHRVIQFYTKDCKTAGGTIYEAHAYLQVHVNCRLKEVCWNQTEWNFQRCNLLLVYNFTLLKWSVLQLHLLSLYIVLETSAHDPDPTTACRFISFHVVCFIIMLDYVVMFHCLVGFFYY